MMVSKTTVMVTCDRCDDELIMETFTKGLHFSSRGNTHYVPGANGPGGLEEFDLCPTCTRDFEQFMHEGGLA
jgi:hypothetical protein